MFVLAGNAVTMEATYTCGNLGTATFSGAFPLIVSLIVTIIKIAIPILLIIFGMMDLGKAVMAQKDDEIKKGQQTFIKRLLAAAIVFFVVVVVQTIVGLIAGGSKDSIMGCMNCFITGEIADDSCISAE